MIAEGSVTITAYLAAEQALGRIAETADVPTLSHTLIGEPTCSSPTAKAARRAQRRSTRWS